MNKLHLRPLLLLFAMVIAGPLFSQQNQLPELQQELSHATSDTAKARLMLKIARELTMTGEDDSASAYCFKALALGTKAENKSLQEKAYFSLGVIYISQLEYSKAKDYFSKALDLARSTGNRNAEGGALMALASCAYHLKEYSEAIEYNTKALDLSSDDPSDSFSALKNIGICYGETGALDKALGFLDRAYAIAAEIGDSMGCFHVNVERATIYHKKNDDNKAITLLKLALLQADNLGHFEGLEECNMKLGDILRGKRDYAGAIPYYKKAYSFAERIGIYSQMQLAATNLSEIFAAKNDTKAKDTWSHRRDSISNVSEEEQRVTRQAEEKKQREKQKLQLAKLKEQVKQKEAELENHEQKQLLFFAVPAILLCLAGGLLAFFLSRRNRNKVY